MQIINGTSFHDDTRLAVATILNDAMKSKARLILTYGFPSGAPWNDGAPVRGRIGRSCGLVKVPLLIKTVRSLGGEPVLDHCIVMIQDCKSKQVLFRVK